MDVIKEPHKYYYRLCLLLILLTLPPVSLILLYPLYKIFVKKQPGIFPGKSDGMVTLGRVLLVLSQIGLIIALILAIMTIYGTMVHLDGKGGTMLHVLLVGGPAYLLIPVGLLIIELAQIKYRIKVE